MKLSNLRIRDRDRALLNLSFDQLNSRHPYLLVLPQDVTETVLIDRLIALGGALHRGIVRPPDGAEVTVTTPAGAQTIRARYVVGGDGCTHAVSTTSARRSSACR